MLPRFKDKYYPISKVDDLPHHQSKPLRNSPFSSIAELEHSEPPSSTNPIHRGIFSAVPKIQHKPIRLGINWISRRRWASYLAFTNIVTLGHNSTHSNLTAPHLWGIRHTVHQSVILFSMCEQNWLPVLLRNSRSLQTMGVIP